MQNERNVSSQENFWPWNLLCNAELMLVVLLFFVLQLKLWQKKTDWEKRCTTIPHKAMT